MLITRGSVLAQLLGSVLLDSCGETQHLFISFFFFLPKSKEKYIFLQTCSDLCIVFLLCMKHIDLRKRGKPREEYNYKYKYKKKKNE